MRQRKKHGMACPNFGCSGSLYATGKPLVSVDGKTEVRTRVCDRCGTKVETKETIVAYVVPANQEASAAIC